MNSTTLLGQCGLTYRQLDYAVRQGWLRPDNPHGRGTDNGREWTNREANVVNTAARLSRVGFPLKRAIEIARILSEQERPEIYLGSGITIYVAPK